MFGAEKKVENCWKIETRSLSDIGICDYCGPLAHDSFNSPNELLCVGWCVES